jgi:hypothetical protein
LPESYCHGNSLTVSGNPKLVPGARKRSWLCVIQRVPSSHGGSRDFESPPPTIFSVLSFHSCTLYGYSLPGLLLRFISDPQLKHRASPSIIKIARRVNPDLNCFKKQQLVFITTRFRLKPKKFSTGQLNPLSYEHSSSANVLIW